MTDEQKRRAAHFRKAAEICKKERVPELFDGAETYNDAVTECAAAIEAAAPLPDTHTVIPKAQLEPTIDECFAAGKGPPVVGSKFREGFVPDTPDERARFEAYMKGHCWDVGTYDADKGCYDTVGVRQLYGVWRDRGYLCRGAPLPSTHTVIPKAWLAEAVKDFEEFEQCLDGYYRKDGPFEGIIQKWKERAKA